MREARSSLRLLIVDDEKQFTNLMARALSRILSHEVLAANSGPEALELMERFPVDLVVTDIRMPEMDGLELLERILNAYPDTLVAAITAHGDLDTAVEFMKRGGIDFLTKPVKIAEMRRTIEGAAERWRLRHRLRLTNEELERANTDLHRAVRDKEKARMNLEAVFQNIPEGILLLDERLAVIRKNGPFDEICPLGHCVRPGGPLRDCIASCTGECLKVLHHTFETGKPVREYHVDCAFGDLPSKSLILNCCPLKDGRDRTDGALLVLRDVTKLVHLEQRLRERSSFHNIVGEDEKMQRIFTLVKHLADVDTTVLVRGESGTGKELIAEALHHGGSRASKPLVRVNCSVLSENLLESELFGHAKGSFTGAVKDRIGRFQAAQGGTLFLDEIGDLSPYMQLKLLRFLERKEFEQVGDSTTFKADVRIVAATHVDLEEKVARGEFREDFYYRLKVMTIQLPPLRERLRDIPLLADHFRVRFSKVFNKHFSDIAEDVLDLFMRHCWPGNVRELKHTLEHACLLCPGGTLSMGYLPPELKASVSGEGPPLSQAGPRDLDASHFLEALRQTAGNKAKAARLLGMSRSTFYRKLALFDIDGGG